ncbi:MAG TPA: protein kinase [Anaerolineales bacterium]|nr:protein kinase [Anaerolineales bacterium]
MKDPLIGSRINRYEIRESVRKSDVIGIYKAYDTKLERYVLLKTILHSSDYSEQAVHFFLAESKTLAKLAHPNIAKVLDFGYESGNLYLISEYVQGQPLSDLMNHPLPWQKAINILLPLTNALLYAHSRGIIHRDLKPDNIVINTDDQPILSDFSLMRIIEDEETRDFTGTNVGLGSPAYISPEQGQGLSVDFRSDIYSLGVIFFEMVTGKKLFYATNSMEIVIQHIMADPPKPRSIIPTLPKMVENIILTALSKDPARRYQTMEEFSNAMKAVIEAANKEKQKTRRLPRRQLGILIGGISLALVAIGLVFAKNFLPAFSSSRAGTAAQTSVTQTEVTSPTTTPGPEIPTEASPSPTPINSLLEGPFAIYKLPAVPVLPGTPLPPGDQAIDPNNAGSIRELARWGKPTINQLALINNDQVILAATSAGLYYFDPKDLSARAFFDTAGSVSVLTVSKDGEWVATADAQGTVAVWSLLTGQRLHQFHHDGLKVLSLDFSDDHSKLVFSDAKKNIYLWNLEQNQEPYPFEKRLTANANRVLFSDAGETVISGGDNFQIMIWDVGTGKLKDQLAAAQKINDMAISSDGHYLALALNQAMIQIWDLSSKTVVNEIKGTDYEVLKPFTFIAFLPNDTNFLTGSADGFIRIWNTLVDSEYLWETTSIDQTDHPGTVNPIKTVAVFGSGSKFVVGFENGLVELWDFTTKKREVFKELGSQPVKRMAISPDDHFLAFQNGESFVDLLSIENDAQNIQIDGTLPRGDPFSPDNKMIGIQADDLNLYPLSVSATAPLFTLYDFPLHGSMGYSPDGRIVSAFSGGKFAYWSTSTGRELKASVLKSESHCRVIYRRDNTFIAAGSENGVIHSDKNLKYFCQVLRNPRTTSEDFLSDGSIIALSLQNQRMEIWDLRKDSSTHEIKLQTPGDVLDVAISNDGKLLAAASASGTIEIYDLETMELIKVLELRTGPVNHVLFSNNSKYLIAGLADGTLRFFGLYP